MTGAVVVPDGEDAEGQCCPHHRHHHHHDHHHHDDDDGENAQIHEPPRCLAEQLWLPWRLLVLHPGRTLLVYLVVNAVFIGISLVVSLLIALVTPLGLCLVLLGGILLGLRELTLIITYPGQLRLVVRDGEANFARLTKRRVTMALDAAQELGRVLGDVEATVRPGAARGGGHHQPHHHRRLRFLQLHQNFAFTLETLLVPLVRALEHVEREHKIGPNGLRLLGALRALTTVVTSDLGRACAELASAPTKEYELRRQQLFLTPASSPAPATTTSATSTVAQPGAPSSPLIPGRLVTALEEKIADIRALLPLIGATGHTSALPKRDAAWFFRELVQRPPKDLDPIATLDLMRADMAVRFNGEQVWIPGRDGHEIDAMFIPARTTPTTTTTTGGRQTSDSRSAMIVCNPNGGLYEFHHLQMDWVAFYTGLGCHVLLFNYRGYGRNQGVPSPQAHNLDALALVEYLRTQRNVTKIGVHGESIGGIAASFLGAQAPPNGVDVLVADRTFANLPALAQRLIGGWAGPLVRILTRWETDNAGHVVEARCPKLVCSDPRDEIVLDGASLKSGIALRLELGDERVDLPPPLTLEAVEASASGGSRPTLTSTSTTGAWWAKVFPMCTTTQPRRISEPGSRPELGGPLTEASIRRFAAAALSLGRRAMRYADQRDKTRTLALSSPRRAAHGHVEIHVAQDPEDPMQRMLPPSASATSTSSSSSLSLSVDAPLSFPEELLAMIWMQLACLDGYCGECFLQAAEGGGFDRIRARTASLLTWGGVVPTARRLQPTLEPFDRQGLQIRPLMLPHVQKTLQTLAEQHPSLQFDQDIGVILAMIEFLHDSVRRRWQVQDDDAKLRSDSGQAHGTVSTAPADLSRRTGRLLVLHCGHNRNFTDAEKAELTDFLRQSHFLPAAAAATETTLQNHQ